jgi:hypothetical protein
MAGEETERQSLYLYMQFYHVFKSSTDICKKEIN